ncbi:S8 family serine peptidase [Tabrizicola sp.]|uniref:S8 family serine peptidase n=1 Tax=Tabrizicola sp. TaxID=2005166 RepID=UPI00261C544C|nr:S8 family serine peptidase [Tabrizicola sp.]MDM7931745.1 S8 family serine peptidase [Tabrizicola sp.]
MSLWKKVLSGLNHGGYVAWEAGVAAAMGNGGRDYLPVFLALRPTTGGPITLAEAIDASLSLPGIRFSKHERDLLATERALAPDGWPHEVRSVAFVPRAVLGRLPAFWRVLQVGPGVAMPVADAVTGGDNLCALGGDLDPLVPVAAVIDDGIGFLNARFRHVRDHTRIKAVWLQAAERVADTPTLPHGEVVCGRVLEGAEIDAFLAEAGDEAEVYARINRALLPVTDGALTNRRTAHGTHVLDLAAGAAPWSDDPLTAVPILAVQLPPASVRETAGRRMEANLVQGLRWIMATALRLANGTDVPPLVVNISLGSLAGPGDRHAFLADWFEYEVARHSRLTGGGKLRLVIAYGNARLARLVARDEIRRSHPFELIWRLLPDDHSPSHLEIRVDTNMVAGMKVQLVPPPGSDLPALSVDWPEAGTGWQLPGPVALLASVAEPGGQSLLHLTLGPTVAAGPLPPVSAGAWRVVLQTTLAEPVRVTARVQRDDTPPGFRTLGRQSWLDHPLGWDWDTEARGYVAPRPAFDAPGCPVTRQGTCVAYAGADTGVETWGDAGAAESSIIFVGAVRPVAGDPASVRPAAYSSEGVGHLARPGESLGPTLVAIGDDGAALGGLRAAGVLSGSVTRMSGTSMAAPQVARALLRYFLTVPPEMQTPNAERRALTGEADWGSPDRRMGHGTLLG